MQHGFAGYLAGKPPVGTDGDPVASLRAGWDLHVGFGLVNPELFRLMYTALHTPDGRAIAAAGIEVLQARVPRVAEAGRLRVTERRAVDLIHAAGTGVVFTLIDQPADERDGTLADRAWESVCAVILTGPGTAASAGTAAAAVTLRAALPGLTPLTAAERTLFGDRLDRIAESQHTPGWQAVAGVLRRGTVVPLAVYSPTLDCLPVHGSGSADMPAEGPGRDAAAVIRYTAFTDTPAGGNPAGVVLDASGRTDPGRLAIAADVGYSETTFLNRRHGGAAGEYDVRYFSPEAEVPFCGHATIAAAVALAEVEDPAAAAAFGAYLRDLGRATPPAQVTVRQGDDMGRPSRITIDIPPGDGPVTVTGGAVPIPG